MITHIVRACGIAFLIWFSFICLLAGISIWRKIKGKDDLYDCN